MYGYGYRYPRVPREIKVLYSDPEYRYKWARAAVMNKATADRRPWISFLRQKGVLAKISEELREAGDQYRAQYDVNPKYRPAAMKKIGKIERALTAVGDARLPELLKLEFGDKFKESYIDDAIATLQKELDHLNLIINYEKPGTEQKQQPVLALEEPKQGQGYGYGYGYGLRDGLGYGLRDCLGYGYFY
jgi:hypothetical protein